MNRLSSSLAALCLLSCTLPALAQARTSLVEAPVSVARPYALEVLLDPVSSEHERKRELERLRTAADGGDPLAQAQLGSLYRLGRQHPADLLERDDEQAEIYLSNAAANGLLHAMAGMAELELRRKRPRDAMLWVYIYFHYSNLLVSKPHAVNPMREANNFMYRNGLLERCTAALEPGFDLASLQGDLDAFTSAHDVRIRERLSWNQPVGGAGRLQFSPLSQEDRGLPYVGHSGVEYSVHALFVAGVSADGKVKRHLLADALPDAFGGRAAAWMVGRMKFEPANSPDLRWGLLMVDYRNQRIGYGLIDSW